MDRPVLLFVPSAGSERCENADLVAGSFGVGDRQVAAVVRLVLDLDVFGRAEHSTDLPPGGAGLMRLADLFDQLDRNAVDCRECFRTEAVVGGMIRGEHCSPHVSMEERDCRCADTATDRAFQGVFDPTPGIFEQTVVGVSVLDQVRQRAALFGLAFSDTIVHLPLHEV